MWGAVSSSILQNKHKGKTVLLKRSLSKVCYSTFYIENCLSSY